MSTSIGFHDVRGLRLASAHRSNSFSLGLRMTRGVYGHDAQGEYRLITDDHVTITIFLTTEAEFDLMLATLPKADDFSDYDAREHATHEVLA